MTAIYEMTNYICPEHYVSGHIYEYDIQRANITMLLKSKMISQETYDKLSRLPKNDREVAVGLMIRDNKRFYSVIAEGIKEAKKDLIERNHVAIVDIVRIANDALFLKRQVGTTTANPNFYLCRDGMAKFVQKNEYTTMLKLGALIIFYNSYTCDIRVIGIKDRELELHDGYMLTFIVHIIEMLERTDIQQIIQEFSETYNRFLKMELPLPFYREFNAASMYMVYTANGDQYMMSSYNGSVRYLNIGFNAFLLRELYAILIERYQSR